MAGTKIAKRMHGGIAIAIALVMAALLLSVAGQSSAWAAPALTTSSQSGAKSGPIANGDYAIQTSCGSRMVVDVLGNSSAEYANVQQYSWNNSNAQKWTFTYNAQGGYYIITSKGSGKALTVDGSKSGSNVCMRANRNWASQRWIVQATSGGYTIKSAVGNIVLDVTGASSRDWTNIHAYASNGSKAQKFSLVPLNKSVPTSTANIAKGVYVIRYGNTGKVVDINAASYDNGANAQIYQANGTYAQRFWIEPAGNGYYRIFNIGSGIALDVCGADIMPCANVWQYGWNGTKAQLWSIQKNSNGTYTFLSACSGLALDVCGAGTGNGTNVWTYTRNNTAAQQFKLEQSSLLSDGYVTLAGAFSPGRVIDVPGASKANGLQLQMYSSNDTNAQKFQVKNEGSGNYSLKSGVSGYYIGVNGSGAIVQQSSKYLWKLNYGTAGSRRGIMFESTNGKASIATTGTGQSAKLRSESPAVKTSHMFLPKVTALNTGSPTSGVEQRALSMINWKSSPTSYMIAVDLTNHYVMVFRGSQGAWKISKTFLCTNGKPSTPTVTGDFSVGAKGYVFGHGYSCYYYTQFYGDYLFHSVLYNEGTWTIQDGTLGAYRSMGCVRLALENAKWIYDNVPYGSHVYVYN